MCALRALKRASTIVLYWRTGRLVFKNYRTGASIIANPVTVEVLHAFEQWQVPSSLLGKMPQYTPKSLNETLRRLVEHTFLVERNSFDAQQDKAFAAAWSTWLPEAGLLHFATKDFPFQTSASGFNKLMRTYLRESAQPAFRKSYPMAKCIRLPEAAKVNTLSPGAYPRVLFSRRTHRRFGVSPLTLESLSTLLFYTWGITGELCALHLGRLPLRTSPSAGSRHPIEAYVVPLRVRGLSSAIYHYDSKRHVLELIGQRATPQRVVEYCAGQSWSGGAAALFIMTAVFPRVMWKYRFSRAYRTVLLDAGHLCQTFCLTATWLGLGAFCTAALQDSLIERDLKIDGVKESVIYACGVGSLEVQTGNIGHERSGRVRCDG